MRVMMKVSFPVEASNRGIKDGSLPKTIMSFIDQMKPEGAYFVADGGKRTAIFFFNLADPSSIPSAAEPFFMNLDAAIELTPAMNAADLKAGLEKAMRHG